MDNTQATITVVELGARLGWIMRVVQLGSWLLFFLAWLQIGRGDWLHHKIRNSYIKYWGKWILAMYALVLGNTILGHYKIVPDYLVWAFYPDLVTHLVFSLLAALVLWFLRVWPAGDAKLFFLLAACYPLMSLPGSFHRGLVFFEVLINTFLPAMIILFFLSLDYIWRTRFANQKIFLRNLGFQREADYLKQQARSLAEWSLPFVLNGYRRAKATVTRASENVRAKGLRAILEFFKDPGMVVEALFDWVLSIVLMSVVTYLIGDVVKSMFLKSLIMFALFFLWSRLQAYIGRRNTMLLGTGITVAALLAHQDADWGEFYESLRNITVFSLCIRLGMEWTMRVAAGRIVLVALSLGGLAALPFIEYILEPLVNLLMLPALQWVVGLVPWSAIAEMGVLTKFSETMRAWASGTAEVSWNAASLFLHYALTGTVLSWGLMGLFFGLALVFARIWDLESYESVDAENVDPSFMPGPKLLEQIKEEDAEFFEETFESLYADGLTDEQATALKAWCEERDIEVVPLAPTMSFASWVFAGYLLTVLFDGHVFKFLYGS
jgi:hypothetical protein